MVGSLARVFVIGDCDQPRDIRPLTPFIVRIEIEERWTRQEYSDRLQFSPSLCVDGPRAGDITHDIISSVCVNICVISCQVTPAQWAIVTMSGTNTSPLIELGQVTLSRALTQLKLKDFIKTDWKI